MESLEPSSVAHYFGPTQFMVQAGMRSVSKSVIDVVAAERSWRSHWELEGLVVKALSFPGIRTLTDDLIDLLAVSSRQSILFEMKACDKDSILLQMRRGLMQLQEYNFLYRGHLPGRVRLCLVMQQRPIGETSWFLDHVDSLDIGTLWKTRLGKLACRVFTHSMLKDFCPDVDLLLET